ncbi:MAG: helix-turn-helix transcriptional regulator [Pseudomonadota bacterium]
MSARKSNKVRDEFARRLRELRRSAGFKTARKFAATLDIDENRYTRYERAEVEPDLGLITRFCEALRVTPNHLLGFEAMQTDGDLHSALPPGFAEGGAAAPAPSGTADANALAQGPQPEGVRMAAWQLAEAHAKLTQAGEDQILQLTATARLFDEIVLDPLAFVARMAQGIEFEHAPRVEQDKLAQCVDHLIHSLRETAR